MAEGWRRSAPQDDLTLVPLSDGGPGFTDVMSRALGGATVSVTVLDPLGRPVPAVILMVDVGGRRTAYIESAQACGLHLLSEGERNPMVASTYGVGQLLAAAVAEGATCVVVGLGGSGTNDGGAGLLAALGAGGRGALAGWWGGVGWVVGTGGRREEGGEGWPARGRGGGGSGCAGRRGSQAQGSGRRRP